MGRTVEMKRNRILVLILIIISLTGCKSLSSEGRLLTDATRARKSGDYYNAAINAIESVRIDNEYKKALLFLDEIYPEAVSYYEQKAEQTKTSSEIFKNDKIATYYGYLVEINEAARTLPPLYHPKTKMQLSFSYTDYSAERGEYSELAAEDHYQEGLRLAKLKTREDSKQAAKEFEMALGFVPGYKDAKTRAAAALEEGTQVVAFFEFRNNAWDIPINQFSDLVQATAISELMKDREVMKFTKFIDRQMQSSLLNEQINSMNALMDDQSRVEIGNLLNSNIFITGTIDAASIDNPPPSRRTEHKVITFDEEDSESSSTSSTSGTSGSWKSGSTAPPPDVAEAEITYFKRTITFNATVTFRAIDVETGEILMGNTVSWSEEDEAEWARWSGDERALDYNDRNLASKDDTDIRSVQTLATEAAKELGKKIASELAKMLR